ncbi:MAG: MBL fold metallo-hydrolase [Candidatus Hodarchaeales archaeon]|jgi:glyoxylase-like metal-dependent hydrolase (beta-lactamase superfamily II)
MTNFVEWASGIYRVVDDIGKQGEEYASYLVLGDEKIAIIDLPSRSIGKDIISFVKKAGRDPSTEISYLILTHTHPDHWAGIDSLKKIKPQIWLHESGVDALKEGKKYILGKQFPKPSTFGMALKSSYKFLSKIGKVKDELIHSFEKSETLDLGGEELILQHSGGHSSDSILIQAYRGECSFIGDEGNIYPDQPASFFIDGTGSTERRSKLLDLVSKLKTEVICPTHQSPIPRPVELYIQNLSFEHKHTKDTIYDLLVSAGQAKEFFIAEEYQRILGISWTTPFKELGVAETTVNAFLKELEKEGRVHYETHTQRWSIL